MFTLNNTIIPCQYNCWECPTSFYPGVKNRGTFLRILPPLPFRQIVSDSGKGARFPTRIWYNPGRVFFLPHRGRKPLIQGLSWGISPNGRLLRTLSDTKKSAQTAMVVVCAYFFLPPPTIFAKLFTWEARRSSRHFWRWKPRRRPPFMMPCAFSDWRSFICLILYLFGG